jgi:DNA-binding HxlR family transcriptional regulator
MKNLYISIKFIHCKNIERDYMAQGTSARESCPKDIELSLLQGPKNFEALVESLKDKYSRGTVNKYLGELFKDGLVVRQGRRGPYELTPKGEREAEHTSIIKRITENLEKEPLEKLKQLEAALNGWAQKSFLVNAMKPVENELKDAQRIFQSYLALKQELQIAYGHAPDSEKGKVGKLLESAESVVAYFKEKMENLIMKKESLEKDMKEFQTILNEIKELEKTLQFTRKP